MLKKFSVLALAGMLCLPAVASAGSSADELAARIDQLTSELNKLRSEMTELKASAGSSESEGMGGIEEASSKSEASSRFQLFGDFRSRIDYVSVDTPAHYGAMAIGSGVEDFFMLNTNFNTAAATQGPLSADGMANFMAAQVGDILAAFAAGGVPTGTATANALTDLNAIMGGLSATEAATMNTMMPMLPANMTMAQLNGALGATLADRANLKPVTDFMKTFSPAQRVALFNALGYSPNPATSYDNKTMWTNRFRLNMQAKATEDVTFKGRLAMYKVWGMQNNPVDYTLMGGPFMLSSLAFDGSTTRQPSDSLLRVDRAYVNWTNIGGQPMWFSVGRRPTTDGPPSQLRQGVDQRMATPTAYMDYPFDGLTLGRAYEGLFGIEDFPGRIRFCYGRGFESGPTEKGDGLSDTDFAGISWDVYNKGDRFFTFQSFIAFNMFNVPDAVTFPNPKEYAQYLNAANNGYVYNPMDSNQNNILDRTNLGDIYHTTAVYMDKKDNLNYFLSLGWSHTDPRAGMDELGTSLLGSFYDKPESKDGYSVYAGIRYDMPEQRLKLGLEYNYGTENWIGFTPGHDDIYQSKLATRGSAAEAYMIYNIAAGEKISKYADFFMRLGYMHIQYDYTGSGFWLGTPVDVDALKNDPLNAQFYTPTDKEDQVYLTMEAYF